ncbi:hypothetical protein BDV12DRAFT_42578 [Aspergillus spectabilis]
MDSDPRAFAALSFAQGCSAVYQMHRVALNRRVGKDIHRNTYAKPKSDNRFSGSSRRCMHESYAHLDTIGSRHQMVYELGMER